MRRLLTWEPVGPKGRYCSLAVNHKMPATLLGVNKEEAEETRLMLGLSLGLGLRLGFGELHTQNSKQCLPNVILKKSFE